MGTYIVISITPLAIVLAVIVGLLLRERSKRIQRKLDREKRELPEIADTQKTVAFHEIKTRSFVTEGPVSSLEALVKARVEGQEIGKSLCVKTHGRLRRNWFLIGLSVAILLIAGSGAAILKIFW